MTTRDVPPWLGLPVPVSAREMSHWEDFRHDARRLPRGRGASVHGWLAALYHAFARAIAFGATVPDIPFPRREPVFRIASLDDETRRFDRLAGLFGDSYRGGAVANYLLGVLAVGFALLGVALGGPMGQLPWLGHGLEQCAAGVRLCAWLARSWPQLPVAFGVLEIAVLAVILFVYLKGRERDHGGGPGDASAGGARFWRQRWHSRWLDYRGLAERFRYAALRGLLGGAASAPEPDADEAAAEDWCTRYFRLRLLEATWPAATPADFASNLIAAIDDQQRYHRASGHRCELLAHRLHAVTVWSFWIAGAITVAELLAHLAGHAADAPPAHAAANLWILATAGLPAFAAAVHGIRSACEFGKLARSSDDMYEALTALRLDVEELVGRDPAIAAPESVAVLRERSERFLHLCTDEATGWRTALSDKNVPLP